MEMSRLTRDGTAEPVSLDQIIRREQGQGNINVMTIIYSMNVCMVMTYMYIL